MSARDSFTPDQVSENELICEKLLGWKRIDATPTHRAYWRSPSGGEWLNTPIFTDWAQAGLILDALKAAGEKPRVFVRADEQWGCMGWHCGGVGSTGPAAIRAAALEYIKAVKS